MTSEALATQERRRDPKETVESLVQQRQKTLQAYCSLSGLDSLDTAIDGSAEITPIALKEFLNIMVDYTAMGHFNLYQRIIEGKERRASVRQTADRVYPSIGETTDMMVEFNDKYESFDGATDDQSSLRDDLSRLGEMLAIRGELEDEILEALLAR